ncbi:MAG: Flp pilus assembly protein CpaB [Rhodoferax sp.]|uniref:Flp pilus assembly protein CpaB n=1 Tax=Rhodoferax sp. TaxID=50421 RepID=UPI0017C08081|nr:Flp pilus assembly protein CpaB [Rhodoferax sp.]NMM20018.1 Flp pilus assembly protein CpaB [Rhodoferax sp.]
MKNTRAIVMILISLVAGAVAVILAARWVGQQAAENTTPVVVASRNLDQGAPLTAAMLQEVPWPSGTVPVGSFKEVKKLEGRFVRSQAFKGEPILEAKLAPEGSTGGLSSSIPSGKRAISVKVNEVVGVAGFALPGSFVDIMVNTMDNKQKSVSKIILKRILVLAVAQEASRDETKPKVVSAVTLEVTPDEAEKIDLARSIGSLSLVLRNPVDSNEIETVGVRSDDLLGKDKAPPVVQAAASAAAPARPVSKARAKPVAAPRPVPSGPVSVEVIRGLQKANSEF